MICHKVVRYPNEVPAWVKATSDECLRSVAEEVYDALRRAVKEYHAEQYTQSKQLLAAGDKSRTAMENASSTAGARCKAGERALRKYWEAKVAARRLGGLDE